MALIECKKCGNLISDRAESCPRCNHKKELNNYYKEEGRYDKSINKINDIGFDEPTESKARCWLLLILGIIVFTICFYALFTGVEFSYKMLLGIVGGAILIVKYGKILFSNN